MHLNYSNLSCASSKESLTEHNYYKNPSLHNISSGQTTVKRVLLSDDQFDMSILHYVELLPLLWHKAHKTAAG